MYHFQTPKSRLGKGAPWHGHPGMGSLCLLQLVRGMCQLLGSDCVFQFWMLREDTLSIVSFMNGCRCAE